MMGRNHVRVWDEVGRRGVELVAVADPTRRPCRARPPAGARGYDDAERMLAEEELDLVSIVAPTSLHLPATLAALRAARTCSSRSRSPPRATRPRR